VETRAEERPDGSYTTYLLDKGLDKVLKKLGEEATEVVIAAKNEAPAELRAEVSDLLFHLIVLLRMRGLPLAEVWNELESRFGGPTRVPGPRPTSHPHS
jgi:phosphoribosyl-ATP pyrophosphohydrolase/phosphoribosyl-AMP cyclohydrolase